MASEKVKGSRTKQMLTWMAMLLLGGTALLLLLKRVNFHTSLGIDMAALVLLTLHVKGIKQVPFSLSSCFLLFSLLVTELVGFGLNSGAMPYIPMLLFLLLADLIAILIWQTRHIKKYALGISITVVTASLVLLGYRFLSRRLLYDYYEIASRYSLSPLQKTGLILIATVFYFLLCTVLLRLVFFLATKLWGGFLKRLSEKLHGIELYILMLVAFVLIVLIAMQTSYYMMNHNGVMLDSLQWFQIFFLLITAVYICLLIKAVTIKENMRIVQDEKDMLSAYNAGLEASLGDMREIRHDMKNLFLTMAGFVERSNDAEMKEFYAKNIVPFMQNALVKNELLDKLKLLQDERLKYFLYYKLMEKMESGVQVGLELSSSVHLEAGYGDMVRLLGILIDNAAEEAKLAHGAVNIKIAEDSESVGIRIENDIRPETKARGIIAGTTDKGLGRGNGLLIAKKIIKKYGNLLLNSYFTEHGFVQYLRITKNRI